MHEYIVPDAIGEPVEGWRVWYVVPRELTHGEPVLRSWIYSIVWEPGKPTEAHCRNTVRERSQNCDTPGEPCNCGIHALKERDEMEDYYRRKLNPNAGLWTKLGRVIGKVALWGKIVPGEDGYRAQYAYPTYLEVMTPLDPKERRLLSPKEIAHALERYQCEVVA